MALDSSESAACLDQAVAKIETDSQGAERILRRAFLRCWAAMSANCVRGQCDQFSPRVPFVIPIASDPAMDWARAETLGRTGGDEMPEHKLGSRDEWQAARDELARLEAEQAERNEEIKRKRLELPWVPVEKEYEFETEDGRKTLAELFDGRSQLLAYNIMFGPDYSLGACPGCTNLGDGLDGSLVHLNHRDVTLLCFSRAPIERLSAYKRRMGWQFPYVSTASSDFAFDFGLALSEEQAQQVPELRQLVDNPPGWLEEWSGQVGAELKDGLREEPVLDRLRARERDRLPHLHRGGARPVRRALLQLPARANAESPTRRAPRVAKGRVPGLTRARTPPRLSAGGSRRIARRAIGAGGVLDEYGAAGDVDDDAAYPFGAVGGEEQGRLRDIFGGA
jgi:predicted dithiol-disulfide oxidoreductase (DUF899 family)